jgi:hypothetical protein
MTRPYSDCDVLSLQYFFDCFEAAAVLVTDSWICIIVAAKKILNILLILSLYTTQNKHGILFQQEIKNNVFFLNKSTLENIFLLSYE